LDLQRFCHQAEVDIIWPNKDGIIAMDADLEVQLAAMANDPEIQRELEQIAAEFRVTEADGLEQS
jgi:hypothetical protein